MNDRLYRSRSDRMLAGVAGGLAEMWDADPSLVRIVWALLVVFTGGIALLVYIVMAIVVPEEEDVFPPIGTSAFAATGEPTTGWVTPTPGAPTEPAPVDPATGLPIAAPPADLPPPAPGALWAASPTDARRTARADARAARRAARSARGEHGGVPGALIGGLVLVALGVFFLAREWLPALDFDWFWPAMLIVLGVVLLVGALGRNSGGSSSGTGGSGTAS